MFCVGEGGALERSDWRRMRGNVEAKYMLLALPLTRQLRCHPLPQGERERHKSAFTRSNFERCYMAIIPSVVAESLATSQTATARTVESVDTLSKQESSTTVRAE